MKYRTIYIAIQKIPYTRISDQKNEFYDLWVVLDIPKMDKRVWIKNNFGQLEISTATLSLYTDPIKRQYWDSFQHYHFKNITQMRKFILNNFVV